MLAAALSMAPVKFEFVLDFAKVVTLQIMILSILLSDFITLTGDLFVLYRLIACFYS